MTKVAIDRPAAPQAPAVSERPATFAAFMARWDNGDGALAIAGDGQLDATEIQNRGPIEFVLDLANLPAADRPRVMDAFASTALLTRWRVEDLSATLNELEEMNRARTAPGSPATPGLDLATFTSRWDNGRGVFAFAGDGMIHGSELGLSDLRNTHSVPARFLFDLLSLSETDRAAAIEMINRGSDTGASADAALDLLHRRRAEGGLGNLQPLPNEPLAGAFRR